KLALALLWERRDEVPGAFPGLAVHDEIVVKCDAGQAQAVAAWLEQAMVDALAPLLDPVPVEVGGGPRQTLGGGQRPGPGAPPDAGGRWRLRGSSPPGRGGKLPLAFGPLRSDGNMLPRFHPHAGSRPRLRAADRWCPAWLNAPRPIPLALGRRASASQAA